MKSYIVNLQEYSIKIRRLISLGLQEHAFILGWKLDPLVKENIDNPILHFNSDGFINYRNHIDNKKDNTLIFPEDFLNLTKEDVQENQDKWIDCNDDHKDRYLKYINNIINPYRILKGFPIIDKEEALECWEIMKKFSINFMKKEE